MKVLWTTPYLPWPPTSGGKLRQFSLLKQLAGAGHRISLLALAKEVPAEETLEKLREVAERLVVHARRPLAHPRTLVGGLLAPRRPLLATVNGLNRAYSADFRALLREGPDVIQIEHSYGFEPFERPLREAGRGFWITEHNVESTMSAPVFSRFPPPLRSLARWDAYRSRGWERRILSQAHGIFAVSAQDAERLHQISGRPVKVIANGVDCAASEHVSPARESGRVMFLGNFEYAPNVDAATFAAREIMPLVWNKNPNAVLQVYGFRMPDTLRARFPDPRIEWRGFVDRVQDAQLGAAVFIAPIRSGGGSKLKVLEAMAAGLPVLATAEAASGLWAQPGRDYLACETAEELAEQLVRLLSDTSIAARIGESGRQYVRDFHDWRNVARNMEDGWREAND